MRTRELKTLKALQPNGKDPRTGYLPPLENEPLQKLLARLNRELAEGIEALQTFNREWASKNIKAQQCRLPIPTPEITFASTRRRELAARIGEVQSQIAIANKERRALSAKASQKAPGADRAQLAVPPKKITSSKNCPLKEHPQWSVYFALAAREELAPDLYAQVERSAKTMLGHALATGIEEP